MPDYSAFEKHIHIEFNNKDLLRQAFTHRSYLNEHREADWNHNERLEFLGDAVLELVSTHYLFEKFPDRPEGELTAIRAALVNTISLAETAQELGMNEYLLLSKGEAQDRGRARQFILANALEALIGAIYMDTGIGEAKKFIDNTLLVKTDRIVEKHLWQDAKSRFQELSQEHGGVTPTYRTLEENGPDHNKTFTIGVFLNETEIARGEGASKQEAEQEAAQKGIKKKGW